MNGRKLIFSQNPKRYENDNLTIFWEIKKNEHKPFHEHLNLKHFTNPENHENQEFPVLGKTNIWID